jgi:membrane protease YdiL (CAAX protease family)
MVTLRAIVKGHRVLAYYILAFAISWGGLLLVIGGPGGIPGKPDQFESLLPAAILAMLAGPSVAGLALTGLVHGRPGMRGLLARLLRWRVGARWYAIALLTAPLLMTAIPLALALLFPAFLPGVLAADDRTSLLLMGIAAGLAAGVFEELGWTGFATPELRLRRGILSTGLIVGFLWGAWHFLVNFWSSGTPSGALSSALLLHSLIFSVGMLPAYRVLMVWVHDRTGGSLLVAMLMHASLTASNVILVPLAISGMTGPAWSLAVALALWVVVGVVSVTGRARLSRQPLQTRAV